MKADLRFCTLRQMIKTYLSLEVKIPVVPKVPEKGVYNTDRSVKYQIPPWNHFSVYFALIWQKDSISKYQANWLIYFLSPFDIQPNKDGRPEVFN